MLEIYNSIKEVIMNHNEFKISQLADDTTLYLSNISSLQNAIELLDKFSISSVLKINKE